MLYMNKLLHLFSHYEHKVFLNKRWHLTSLLAVMTKAWKMKLRLEKCWDLLGVFIQSISDVRVTLMKFACIVLYLDYISLLAIHYCRNVGS